jgi:hypothetical protein
MQERLRSLRFLNATEEMALRREAAERIDALETVLRAARTTINHADTREGVCCCGDMMALHGTYSGHSPVDAGQYHAMQVVQEIDLLLGDRHEADLD